MDTEKLTFENGFAVADAALSLRRAYLHALQADDLELDPRPEEQEIQIEGWTAVAKRAASIFEGDSGESGMDDLSMPESDLAAAMYRAYRTTAGGIYDTLDELPDDERVAWIAVGRHSLTLIGFEEDEPFPELESHETHWREWAQTKRGIHAAS